MKTLVTIASACIIASFPSLSAAEWPDFPFVYTEGVAEVDVAPDKATISFRVAAFDKESAVALSTMQSQLEKALAILEAADIPDEAITGSNLVKDIERARDDYRHLEILGYFITRYFEVELKDLSKFSSLVAGLMDVDNVASVDAYFDVGDRERIEADLVQQAAKDARSQAENLAKGMGVEIDSVFAVSESDLDSLEPTFSLASLSYVTGAMRMSPPGSADTIFQPDTITIRKNVNVMFKLEEQ